MSQGGSAPRPASRRSSRSPATAAASSPPLRPSHGRQGDSRARPLHDHGRVAVSEGDGRGQQPRSRAADSGGISNPAGPRGVPPAEASPSLQQPSAVGGSPRPAMGTGQYTAEGSPSGPFAYQGPSTGTPQPTNPTAPPTTTSSPAGAPATAERGFPQGVQPYPLAARRILTPKSPRTSSLSRAAMRTVEAQHLTSLPAPTPKGVTSHDVQTLGGGPAPIGGPPQFHNPIPPGQETAALTQTRPTSGLSRSLSQPSSSHGLASAPPLEPLQPVGLKREHSGRPVFSGPQFAAPVPANRGLSAPGLLGEGRWGPGLPSALPAGGSGIGNLRITEGQTLLTITPRYGEEIVVPVDVHQGSKQQDEKRQKNAGASARFRQRKKEREREQQEEMQRLENRNRELEQQNGELGKRCRELEAERDFYRSERNRLRDLVSRTPGISEWADRGPPSPISSRSGASMAPDTSALHAQRPPPPPSQAPSQPQSHQVPYPHTLAHPHPHPRASSYGDSSVLEPPTRRRRTDSEPQRPTTSYNLVPPASLPPIAGPPPPPPHPPAFGIPQSPHMTPPPGSTRLPPLRFDQPRPPSTTPPPLPSGLPPPAIPPHPPGPYSSLGKVPHETGWATDPRGQTEGGPR
ncbi:hypothetical protein VTK56DRAFT_358 [Thermocarpiscus australiensis]